MLGLGAGQPVQVGRQVEGMPGRADRFGQRLIGHLYWLISHPAIIGDALIAPRAPYFPAPTPTRGDPPAPPVGPPRPHRRRRRPATACEFSSGPWRDRPARRPVCP